MKLIIRPESSADYDVIDHILFDAFNSDEEVRLVRSLRISGHFDPKLSLVAIASDSCVGYTLFTPVIISDGKTRPVKVAGLGPVAVRFDFQRRGLVRKWLSLVLIYAGPNPIRPLQY